nr:DUF4276 family protein [Myxococcus sp. RHSTA-1-4]
MNIIVEGQTEETFVRDLLAPHLGERQVFVSARCVETGRRKQRIFRGGLVSYAKARQDILRWLAQDPQALVSTMFDCYALPEDFPRPQTPRGSASIMEWVARLEAALAADIGDSRFLPYLQVHEFEALLFSDVAATGQVLGASPPQLQRLQEVRGAFETPEHINDSPETAPSKRLIQLFPRYDKTFFGPTAVSRIGLESVRRECPHFASWLTKLERLSTQPEEGEATGG